MTMQLPSRPLWAIYLRTNLTLIAALILVSPTTSFAQGVRVFTDDTETDRNVIRLGAEKETVRIENAEDVLVRSVAQSNPTTAIELSKAIGWMMDIDRLDKAGLYLGKLAQLELDGESSYELNRTIGSDLFYRIARSSELQPEGREVALKVFTAASKWANSDARIESLIKQVATKNDYSRGEAFAKLNRVGKKGVARLIETFGDQTREADFPALRGALYAFGDSALGPLLGAAESTDPSIRIEAIRALAKLESNRAVDMLMRTSLSQSTMSPYRELAGYHLAKAGRAPNPDKVEERICNRVKRFLEGRRDPVESLLGKVERWKWNDETGKLEVTEIESSVASRMRAADLARTLYEINPDSEVNRELHLITQLESRKRMAGASESIDVDAYLEQAENIDAAEMEQLLVKAIDLDLVHAATAACEVIKQIGSEAQVVGSERRPLVNAILVGDRHLQFAALDAIAEINPKTAYAGSSYVADLATWLAASRFKQKCAIGHIKNEATQRWSYAIGPEGWASVAANSSQELFEKAAADPDVAILIVSDTLHRPEHRELVQQLRSHWKTKRMPIGLLSSSAEKLIKSVRYTEGIDRLLTFPIALDQGAVQLQLAQLEEKVSPWNVSSDDRFRHAARAVSWLENAAVDPDLSFYNFASHQKQLLGLLYHPEFTSSAAKILATQPSAVAQRAMLGFVSQSDLPIEARETVADAFEAAVERSGTMLTTREIRLQYERYNASENQPKETQKVLGRILDVIEARSKSSE